MLEILRPGGRQNEWSATLNSSAPVVYDHNTSINNTSYGVGGIAARSIRSDRDWRGSVVYNDDHVVFECNNEILVHESHKHGRPFRQ